MQSILCYTELKGQEKAKGLVSRTLRSGRIPHAYLFKGPDGVGKKLFARGVAAAVNCRQAAGRSCGSCTSCKKFLSGNHPDFMVVSPEKGAIKIDQVRQVRKALGYPPYESAVRVVLLEDVHTMRQEAANSLLKTLEEPPPDNLLILTAAASREVLATISSRCQAIPFFGLSTEETEQILCDRQPDLDRQTARLLARLTEGSPGQALLLNEMDMLAILKKVVELVTDGRIDPDRDVGVLLQVAEEMAGLKENLPVLLGLLRIWLRDQLMEDAAAWVAPHRLAEDRTEVGVPKSWSSEELFAKLRAVNKAERELGRNCNRALVCEVLLFHLL